MALRNNILLLLVCVSLSMGLYSRMGVEVVVDDYPEAGITQDLAITFEQMHGLKAQPVYYTSDKGIRGLQIAIPECRGNLQILFMGYGDEFVGLWEGRAKEVNYSVKYLFKNNILDKFPESEYWFAGLSSGLARRLHLRIQDESNTVVAAAFPQGCDIAPLMLKQSFRKNITS